MNNTNFSQVQSANRLRPEARRAIAVLGESLPQWKKFYSPNITSDALNHNSKWFITSKLTKDKLPETSDWGWNQSNGKSVVSLDDKFMLELYKYNSIRKRADAKQPSFKMWVGHITVRMTNETFTFIWCEKGYKQDFLGDTQITLKDLAFLAEFTDRKTSEEFGWI